MIINETTVIITDKTMRPLCAVSQKRFQHITFEKNKYL